MNHRIQLQAALSFKLDMKQIKQSRHLIQPTYTCRAVYVDCRTEIHPG